MIRIFFDANSLLCVLFAVAIGIGLLIKKNNKIHRGIKIAQLIVFAVTLSYLMIGLMDIRDTAFLGRDLSFVILANLYITLITITENIIYYLKKSDPK